MKPFKKGYLKVSKIHSIHYRFFGDQSKTTILYCHGGPGGEGLDELKNHIDFSQYSFLTYDQRGCGKSKPFLSTKNNNTNSLVQDINKLLKELNIKRVIIMGDSWGTTLALHFANRFPNKVKGLILNGLFLGKDSDLKWLYELAPQKYKVTFKKIFNFPPMKDYKEFLEYAKKNSDNQEFCYQYDQWEEFLTHLKDFDFVPYEESVSKIAKSLTKIESHFFTRKCFQSRDIFKEIKNIKDIPVILNHGINDRVCLIENSIKFNRKHKRSYLFRRRMRHIGDEDQTKKIIIESLKKMESL